jgi:hypothetical protein
MRGAGAEPLVLPVLHKLQVTFQHIRHHFPLEYYRQNKFFSINFAYPAPHPCKMNINHCDPIQNQL